MRLHDQIYHHSKSHFFYLFKKQIKEICQLFVFFKFLGWQYMFLQTVKVNEEEIRIEKGKEKGEN